MNMLQFAIETSLDFLIIYSFIRSINVRYYSQVSKNQNKLLIISAGLSCITTQRLNYFVGLFLFIFSAISLFAIQRLALNYSYKLITLSNSILCYFILNIKMCAKLTTKIVMMFTKNITNNAIFFTNILLIYAYFLLFRFLLFKMIFEKDNKFSDVINNYRKRDLVFVIFLAFLLAIPNIFIYNYNLYNNNLLLLTINLSTIILAVFIFISFLFKQKEYSYAKFDLEQEKLHNRTLCDTVDSLRLLKHDYNNILQSINGYIITKQYDSLDEHIKNLINNTKDVSNLECICPEVINQPAIYGVINEKYYKAKNKKIPFRIEVFEDISSISLDSTKLSRILGILLDNAIEASERSDNPLVEIKFIYNTTSNTHMIKIKNTFENGKVIDTNKIFEKGESSKKKKSGLGLWEVKRIINNENNAYIYANIIENNKFEQTLIC